MKIIGWSLLSGMLLVAFLPTPSHAQDRFMMTTVVENGEVTNWNFGCPADNGASAMLVSIDKLDIPADKIDPFSALIDEFEREHGVYVKSKTRVQHFRTEEDTIKTMTEGPYDATAQAICDIVRESYKR